MYVVHILAFVLKTGTHIPYSHHGQRQLRISNMINNKNSRIVCIIFIFEIWLKKNCSKNIICMHKAFHFSLSCLLSMMCVMRLDVLLFQAPFDHHHHLLCTSTPCALCVFESTALTTIDHWTDSVTVAHHFRNDRTLLIRNTRHAVHERYTRMDGYDFLCYPATPILPHNDDNNNFARPSHRFDHITKGSNWPTVLSHLITLKYMHAHRVCACVTLPYHLINVHPLLLLSHYFFLFL